MKNISIKSTIILTLFVLTFFFKANSVFAVSGLNTIYYTNNTISLYFNETITSTAPSINDFSVNVNGSPISINNLSLSDNNINFNVSTSLKSSDSVLVSYIPGVNPIVSVSGNAPAINKQKAYFVIENISINKTVFVGDTMYSESVFSNNIYAINTKTDTLITRFNTNSQSLGLVNVGKKVYLIKTDNSISVIDSTSNTLTTPITGMNCNDTVTDSNSRGETAVIGQKIYFTCGTNIKVFDTSNNTISATISIGSKLKRPTIVGNKIYWIVLSTTGLEQGIIKVVNIINNSVTTINTPLGIDPVSSIDFNSKLYVLSFHSDNVSVIDTTNDTVIKTINVNFGPEYSSKFNNNLYIPLTFHKLQ